MLTDASVEPPSDSADLPETSASEDDAADNQGGIEGQKPISASNSVISETDSTASSVELDREKEAKRLKLESAIQALVTESDTILAEFKAMLQAYSNQKINEQSVTITKYDYRTPSLLSGAFIKKAIMTAGPIMAIGFMVCIVLIVRTRSKEEKRLTKA